MTAGMNAGMNGPDPLPTRAAGRTLWPLVAIAALAIGACVVILVWVPASDAQARSVVTTLVGIIAPLLSAAYAATRVEGRVDQRATDVAQHAEQVVAQVVDDPGAGSGGTPPPTPRHGVR